ncbi:MAG: hypothetical protein EPN21_07885 [Methylococcaceae bacterium]|nr:MAG: hypothetical protein EPN21_07885 [Methylococcaceae bacterium]
MTQSIEKETSNEFRDGVAVVTTRGICLDGRWFNGPALTEWLGLTVGYTHWGGDQVSVWESRGEVDMDVDAYLGEAVAEDAPYFLRHRFGEGNQVGSERGADEYLLDGFLCLRVRHGRLYYELDYYSEGRTFSGADDFDDERWSDALRDGDAEPSRAGFQSVYRVARALKRGRHVTFNHAHQASFTALAVDHPAVRYQEALAIPRGRGGFQTEAA